MVMDSSSWWKIDRSHKPRLTDGATPLLEVCMQTYGWTEERARRVLRAYEQFLALKKRAGDFEGKVIEPSNDVDQMWVQHCSTRNYEGDCKLISGGLIKRDGYHRLDAYDDRAKRVDSTRLILKALFGDKVDEEIWNFYEKSKNSTSLISLSDRENEEEGMKVLFRSHGSMLKEAEYIMPLSACFVVVGCIYAEGQGKEYRDLLFVVDEKELPPDSSLGELGFANVQVIDVMSRI